MVGVVEAVVWWLCLPQWKFSLTDPGNTAPVPVMADVSTTRVSIPLDPPW